MANFQKWDTKMSPKFEQGLFALTVSCTYSFGYGSYPRFLRFSKRVWSCDDSRDSDPVFVDENCLTFLFPFLAMSMQPYTF